MIILGIDPGLNISGYGVIRYKRRTPEFISAGTIKTSAACDFPEKLEILYRNCCDIIGDFKPDVIAIEETFTNVNPRSSLKLGHARGVLMLAGRMADKKVYEYPATIVKKSLTGTGGATKKQVRYMVMKILHLSDLPAPYDISDALAIALTHYHHLRFQILSS